MACPELLALWVRVASGLPALLSLELAQGLVLVLCDSVTHVSGACPRPSLLKLCSLKASV